MTPSSEALVYLASSPATLLGLLANHFWGRTLQLKAELRSATLALHAQGLYLVQVGSVQVWCKVESTALPVEGNWHRTPRPKPEIPQPE
jgi:hypothetical protein